MYVALLVRFPFSEASARQLSEAECTSSKAPATMSAVLPEARANGGSAASEGSMGAMKNDGNAMKTTATRAVVPAGQEAARWVPQHW